MEGNFIAIDNGSLTTSAIKNLLNPHKYALVVHEETDDTDYGITSYHKHSPYAVIQNSLDRKLALSTGKFFYLVRHGLIHANKYGIVIFRVTSISRALATTFRIFYYSIIEESLIKGFNELPTHPRIVCFTSEIKENDAVLMHCRIINIYSTPSVHVEYINNEECSKLKRAVEIIKSNPGNYILLHKRKGLAERIHNITGENIKEYTPDKGIGVKDIILVYDLPDHPIPDHNNIYILVDQPPKNLACLLARPNPIISLLKQKEPSLYITETHAIAPHDSAFQMLSHIFYLIKKLFDDHMLYIKNIHLRSQYCGFDDNLFKCKLYIPKIHTDPLFSKEYESSACRKKKDAQKEISLVIINELYHGGYLDKHLRPISDKFIYTNPLYYRLISQAYNIVATPETDLNLIFERIKKIKENFIQKNPGPEESVETLFRRGWGIVLSEKKPIIENNELGRSLSGSRIRPNCLMKYPESKFYIYAFLDNENVTPTLIETKDNINFQRNRFSDRILGIATSKSFKKEAVYKKIRVKFMKKESFSEKQKELLIFYQIILFSLHYKKMANLKVPNSFCYLALPLTRQLEIDWQYLISINGFLISNVYENTDPSLLTTNLLFNPFTKIFYVYAKPSKESILKKQISMKNNKYNFAGDSTPTHSYLEYFEDKYEIQLVHRADTPGLLFHADVYTGRGVCSLPSVLSSEIMHITSIGMGINGDYSRFRIYLEVFETVALADQLKDTLKLDIPLQRVVECITPSSVSNDDNKTHNDGDKNIIETNYERLEFLGDSILKYTASIYTFLNKSESVHSVVMAKDNIISNDSLANLSKLLGIPQYVGSNPYSESFFTPPALFKLIENNSECLGYIQYFNCDHMFRNMKSFVAEKDVGRKTCADVLEAMIGAYYLEFGIKKAQDFIYDIGILKNENENLTNTIDGLNYYSEILDSKSIFMVEEIIDYKFTCVGLIEKALIHPSSHNNLFGSVFFNKLELLGDCVMDLLVTDYIFRNHSGVGPEILHNIRKSMVNNWSLAQALFKLGLCDYIHTCFDLNEVWEKIKSSEKVSKVFSDIFEAVLGAILVDCKFDYSVMEKIFKRVFLSVLHECMRDV
ncbi:Endoribonuclease Dicer like protein 3a [Astathelohania contejeani]|uniref:Endoribonuclease Dicer like protein 3a n=1 Tax=Astathelohania contejeani TaxID=164912 RepID=A0ABQ7HXJ8_9MICR|nr:Endoribonuclease Dicer like protein 3a [Thelohania contejeani]